jgi:2-alkyl-3-oxoalkanoate reductase
MKVFVAGATGAVGRRLVPMLVAGGHDVVAMTRSSNKASLVLAMGAEPVVADGLDRAAVVEAVASAGPDVVIHQMTGLVASKSIKRFDAEFALTNELRTRGTDYLLEGAHAGGAHRFIAQSFGGWNYERSGSGLKTEDDALDPHPPANQRQSLAAIRHMESATLEAGGLALRFGTFYGPGTGFAIDGDLVKMVAKRRFPIVGNGGGIWSFIHIDDVASATIAAIERGGAGIYNIVDDDPAPVAEWLPELARAIGAPSPRRVPVWLGRLAVGDVGVSMMTRIRGVSNAKAVRELGWQPAYKSWRDGFHTGLRDAPIQMP